MELRKVAQQTLKLALVLSVLTAPFVLMVQYAKTQTEAERANRLARIYTPATSLGAGSLPRRSPAAPESVADALDEVYAPTFGCWQVHTLPEPRTGLQAIWFGVCPTTPLTTKKSGEYRYPKESFYLSAWAEGDPKLSWARTEAELLEDRSNTEHTRAGMLFLPATKDGSGYYVAAWEQVPTGGEVRSRRGMQIGRYDNPPISVGTSGGRVYLDKPWDWEVSTAAAKDDKP